MVDVDVYCSHVPALADLFLKWRKTPGERRGPGLQTPLGPRCRGWYINPKDEFTTAGGSVHYPYLG
jgi:hypothetical protein